MTDFPLGLSTTPGLSTVRKSLPPQGKGNEMRQGNNRRGRHPKQQKQAQASVLYMPRLSWRWGAFGGVRCSWAGGDRGQGGSGQGGCVLKVRGSSYDYRFQLYK